MKKYIYIIIILVILIVLIGVCSMLFGNRENKQNFEYNTNNITNNNSTTNLKYVDENTTVGEIINDKDFEGFGNLIFPVDIHLYMKIKKNYKLIWKIILYGEALQVVE